MSEIAINYKGSSIATMDASGTKTLETEGKYCEDDIEVVYTRPSTTPTLQDKTKSYTPTESAQSETFTCDNEYDGLDEVTVNVGAISSTYVGSGITRRSSTDLTASGATVTAPSGYYESSASKAVSSGSATTPATTITSSPSITVSSAGLITASNSKTQSVTPTVSAGWVGVGTAGTITVSGSNTKQLTTKGYQLITPTTSQQTLATADTYLTGAQVVKGDANLVAANIVSGKSIFGVSGSAKANFATGTFTTGSSSGAVNITIPYTGSGYPVTAVVFLTSGYNSSSSAYSTVNRYAVMMWSMSKAVVGTAPAHGSVSTNTADQAVTQTVFKNSASDAQNFSRNSSMTTATFMNSDATNGVHTPIRFKSNTTLSYYTKSSSYGLLPSTSYTYVVIYSS